MITVVLYMVAGSGNKTLQDMPGQWPNLWQGLNLVNMFCLPKMQQPVLLNLFMMA